MRYVLTFALEGIPANSPYVYCVRLQTLQYVRNFSIPSQFNSILLGCYAAYIDS